MENEHHDVVIVGAGPAGLKAAEVLAAAGKDVLVLEKNKVVGPKVCAGGISDKCRLLGIPYELFERRFTRLLFQTNLQNFYADYVHPLVNVVDRGALGSFMADIARKNGAVIRMNCYVSSFSEGCVVCSDGTKIGYDFLIGADGSNSVVRKCLGVPTKRMGFAFQYIVSGNRDDLVFSFERRYFGSWYGWIFPHNGYFSVGTGGSLNKMNAALLRKRLDKWCEAKNIDISNAEFQAATINHDYRGFKFGNVFLVGDAGGFASGFTGEGIYSAIMSGMIAANVIMDEHYDYESALKPMLKIKNFHESVNGLCQNRFLMPFLSEFACLLFRTGFGRKMCVDLFF